MSHSVTITRTTTSTTNTSYIVLNTGYMKTVPGILKLLQLILGIVCVGILSYYFYPNSYGDSEIFFFLMAVTFMIGTFILLLSCLVSLSTGGIISKTIYEVLYHAIAGILLLIASIFLIVKINDTHQYFKNKKTDAYWAAGIMGLVNAFLYFVSTFMANKSYRGI